MKGCKDVRKKGRTPVLWVSVVVGLYVLLLIASYT